MIELTDKNISGKALDHLGLVASTIYDIGLVQKIDDHFSVTYTINTINLYFNSIFWYQAPQYISLENCRANTILTRKVGHLPSWHELYMVRCI